MVRWNRERPAILTVALTGALTIGGCSGSASSGAAGPGGPGHPASPRPAATGTARPARTTRPGLSLRLALLTAGDLGPSFTALPSDGGSGSPPVSAIGCPSVVRLPTGAPGKVPGAQAVFIGGLGTPIVEDALTIEAPPAAGPAYRQLRAALTSCHSLGLAESGYTLLFALRTVSLGGPPGSGAVRMDGRFSGMMANGYIAVDRIGDVIQQYLFVQFGSQSSGLARAAYGKAVERLRTFCAGPGAAMCASG